MNDGYTQKMRREVSTKREMAPVVDPFLFLPVGEGIPAGLDKTWRRLFVRNLPLDIVSAELFDHFSRFGDILEAVVLADQISKVSKGCGVVVFKHERDASLAMNTDSYIDGRKLNKQWGFKGEMVRRAKFNVVNGGSAYMRQTRFSVVRTANIQAIDAVDISDFRSVFPSSDATDYVSCEISEEKIMRMAKEKARKRLAAQLEFESQRRRRHGVAGGGLSSGHTSGYHSRHQNRRHHRGYHKFYNGHRFGSAQFGGCRSDGSEDSGSTDVGSSESAAMSSSPSHGGLAEPTIGLTKFPNRTVENDFKRALKRAGHLSYQRSSVAGSGAILPTPPPPPPSLSEVKLMHAAGLNVASEAKTTNSSPTTMMSDEDWWKRSDESAMKSRRGRGAMIGSSKSKSSGSSCSSSLSSSSLRFKPAKPPRFRSSMGLPLSRLASLTENHQMSKVQSSIFVVPSVAAADQTAASPVGGGHHPTHHVHQLVTPRSGLSHSVVTYDSSGKASRIVDVRLVKPNVAGSVCQSSSQESSLVASPMSSPISTTMNSSDGSPVSRPPPTLSEYLGHPMYSHPGQHIQTVAHPMHVGTVPCYGYM